MNCLNIAVPASATSAPLGYKFDDPVLRWIGPDKGFCLDLASTACYASQANPAGGEALVNFDNVAATRNGVVTMTSGITFTAGKGLNFTGVTNTGNVIEVANAFEAIQADTNKAWMFIGWVKFPAASDWPAAGNARTIAAAGNYTSAADLFTFYLTTSGTSKNIVIHPQTAVGAATALGVADGNTFGGKLCQVFVYRTASGATAWRLKAADGSATYASPTVTLATNTANLSGLTWRFGAVSSAQAAFPFKVTGTWNSDDTGCIKFTFYRVLLASTSALPSTVTPTMIADADFTDTVARGVYS